MDLIFFDLDSLIYCRRQFVRPLLSHGALRIIVNSVCLLRSLMHRVVVYSLCLIRPLVHCALRLIDDRLYVFYLLVVPSLWQSTSLTVLYIKSVFKAVFRQCSTHNYGSMVEPGVPSLQEDLLWTIGELGGTTRKIALWKNGVRRYFQKDRLLILLQRIKRLWITENRHLLYVKKSVEALVDNVGNGLRPHSSASSEPEAVGPLKKEGPDVIEVFSCVRSEAAIIVRRARAHHK